LKEDPEIEKDKIINSFKYLISFDRTEKSLKTFKSKKSPGPDGIKPTLFKHLNKKILQFLQFIYKASVYLEYTPKLWKESNVTFIPKIGKDTYTLAKSYRPISLSNYFLKGLERLLGWHMKEMLEKFPVHVGQHGFCNNKGTETAISETVNFIEKNINTSAKHVVAVSLDISSAFDTIQPLAIKDSLIKHGGNHSFVNWYYNYITKRYIQTTLHGHTLKRITKVGFPQGGVVSADFWKIVFNPAIEIIKTT
jgi:hypothetical protein